MAITRQQVQDEARRLIGVPWVHQGRNPEAGVDCLGVILVVGKEIGYLHDFHYDVYMREPDGVTILREMRKYLIEIPVDEAKEGDIPVIRMAGERVARHLGILVRGQFEMNMVHATHDMTSSKVREESYRRWKPFTINVFQFRGIS